MYPGVLLAIVLASVNRPSNAVPYVKRQLQVQIMSDMFQWIYQLMLVIKDSVIAEYKLSVINLSLHTLYWYQGSIFIIQWLLCVIQPTFPDTLRREKHIPVSNISQFQTFLFCITSHYIFMYNVYVYIYQVKFQMELRSVWQLHTGSCLQCYWTEVTLEYIILTYTLKSDSLSLWPSSVLTFIVCPSVSSVLCPSLHNTLY